MDIYRRLQERLDTHPSGAPAHEAFTRILKIMFTPREAEIACQLTFKLEPINKIAEKTGIDIEELSIVLEHLADRGALMGVKFRGKTAYSLVPTAIGLYEYTFMKPELYPEIAELGRLWDRYHKEAFTNSFAGSPTPQMRVIPVQKTISLLNEIVTYDQVNSMIDNAHQYAVSNCSCRISSGKNCGKPIETCLVFDGAAKVLVDRDRARWITREEAYQILKASEEAGLVHCISNTGDRPTVICNCCSCCCNQLRGITELHNPNVLATSAFVAELNNDLCVGCLECLDDRCPVNAIEEYNEIVEFEQEKCIGCGLCVSVCPTEALFMRRREVVPQVPATGKELMTTMLKEKGKLEAFHHLNNES